MLSDAKAHDMLLLATTKKSQMGNGFWQNEAQEWEGVNFDETGASRAMLHASMNYIKNDLDVRILAPVYTDIKHS